MKVIGLCGATGSGKSTVGRYWESLGAFYIDTDEAARAVTSRGSKCLSELADYFGGDILKPSGCLDRQKLFTLAMSGEESYKKLNSITHGYIIEEVKKRLSASGAPFAVVDAPLLFESGFDKECDYTVGVVSKKRAAALRASLRDGVSGEVIEKRLKKQKSAAFLRKNCDFIIENNADISELLRQAANVFARIKGG
ncbi:MAG: dephospho-CoA kinase [Eubacteriales bacterium]